jgi:HD-GYP domain-containing protein (c-di-GMP phosphodiesterase class II)
MHDVGKIYVDKAILTKKEKLTDEEFEHIKSHTIHGEKIIGESEYLRMSSEIARNHHERYDGTGYPDGKKGEDIPISARIVSLADIYDALRSERSYKPGFSHEKSYKIIAKGDGRVEPQHFDPIVLEAFKKIHGDFKKIYEELKD